MCFLEDPPGTFFKIPPLPLSYPRGDGDGDGDRFLNRMYIDLRGELGGY